MNVTDLPQGEDIDFGKLLGLLLQNKWLIVAFVVIFACVAHVYLLITQPIFRANALIQVEKKQSGLGGFGDLSSLFGVESDGSTEMEVIKSRFVLGEVVSNQFLQIVVAPRYLPFLGEFLAWRYVGEREDSVNSPYLGLSQFNTGGEYIKIGGLYVPEALASKPMQLRVVSKNKYQLYSQSGELLLEGVVGVTASGVDGKLALLVSELRANEGAEFDLSIKRRIDAIAGLRNSLVIVEKGQKTGVISLILEGASRQKIKDTLNEVVRVYQKQNVKRLSEEAERSINFLTVQVRTVRAQLEAAEQKLNDYRTASSTIDMQFETQAVLNQIVTIEAQLNELALKESEISRRYKKNHPLYVALINQKSRLIIERDRINKGVEKLPATQQEILRLMRDVEVSSEVYLQLLNKLEELKVIRAGTVGNVRILDHAEVLTAPVKPRRSGVLALSLILGGMFGVGLVFLKHFLQAGLLNPSEVQEAFGLNSYGVIPLSVQQRKQQQAGVVSVLAVDNPADIALEAVRGIRTSLHFAMMEANNNIVMLTGPSPEVGKSFVSTNLAVLAGASDQRILLIDGDMRRGHLHEAFGKERSPGLSNILSEGLALDAARHSSVVHNVDFITTGSIPPNPSELVMSSAFTQFLEVVSKEYDIVLIDTPPVLAVTDAVIIGKQAGTTMLVVRHKLNTLKEVKQTANELEQSGVTVRGYIYNFYEHQDRSYGYGNKYYNYRYEKVKDEA